MEYELRDFPNYGDLMTKEDWINCVKNTSFIDYDGFGVLATETHKSDIYVWPSCVDRKTMKIVKVCKKLDFKNAIQYDESLDIFTHVLWFNR